MRTSGASVLGGIIGAAVVWLWGREIEACVEERARAVRTKTAEGVQAVQAKAGKVLDRGADALRRVEDFLQDTREDVNEALQAGRDAIRCAPADRRA